MTSCCCNAEVRVASRLPCRTWPWAGCGDSSEVVRARMQFLDVALGWEYQSFRLFWANPCKVLLSASWLLQQPSPRKARVGLGFCQTWHSTRFRKHSLTKRSQIGENRPRLFPRSYVKANHGTIFFTCFHVVFTPSVAYVGPFGDFSHDFT